MLHLELRHAPPRLVDVPGERLVLKPFGRSVEWEGMTLSDPVRLRVYHGVILGLDIEFNGKESQAMLDLGMSTMVINEPLRAAMHLEAEGVSTLGVGGMTFPDLPTRVRDLAIFQNWDPDGTGFVIVGAPETFACRCYNPAPLPGADDNAAPSRRRCGARCREVR